MELKLKVGDVITFHSVDSSWSCGVEWNGCVGVVSNVPAPEGYACRVKLFPFPPKNWLWDDVNLSEENVRDHVKLIGNTYDNA